MINPDTRIGSNLQAVRGATSQAALASAMKQRGWKWSQPTVAAVEKGERALKLAEAVDVCSVLGTTLSDLLPPRSEVEPIEIQRAWSAVRHKVDAVHSELTGLAGQLDHFAMLAEANPGAVDEIWGAGDTDWRHWVRWSADDQKRFASQKVLVPSEDRRASISAALRSIIDSVVIEVREVQDGATAHPAE